MANSDVRGSNCTYALVNEKAPNRVIATGLNLRHSNWGYNTVTEAQGTSTQLRGGNSSRKVNDPREHILAKTIELEKEISGLDDPDISRICQLLKSELQAAKGQGKHARAMKRLGSMITNKSSATMAETGVKTTQTEVAQFVSSITRELVTICADKDMKFLAYLVDMARVEATNISKSAAKSRIKLVDNSK